MPGTIDSCSWYTDLMEQAVKSTLAIDVSRYDIRFEFEIDTFNNCKICHQPSTFNGCLKVYDNDIELRCMNYPEYDKMRDVVFMKGYTAQDVIFNIPPTILNRLFLTLKRRSFTIDMKGQVQLC